MINIYNINLLDLMPESLKKDPDVQALCDAITPEIQSISNEIVQCILLARIDDLSEEVLDLLAWQFHVDFYDSTLSIETKRELVKNSMRWHKRKGTPVAVEELVTAVFGDGIVLEWFDFSGEPYHFKVQTFNLAVTQGDADLFTRALNSVKNTRSYFDGVEVTISDELPFYLAGIVYAGDNLTIEQVV